MEMRISEGGYLNIKRGKEFKVQCCPFASTPDNISQCGHWCPQFGEPCFPDDDGKMTRIFICQEKQLFGKIIDERS